MEKASGFLKLEDISKSFGNTPVLKGLNAEISKGELVSFIGPSGCGKSTLLRCIAGFTRLDGGRIVLDSKVINDELPHRRKTGMVFQNYALFPHLSVENNINYGLRLQKLPRRQIRKRVEELLELVNLPGLGSRRIDQLSGGQQQRVALARALSLNPKILLLDEPLSNLDANLRVRMRNEIKRIKEQFDLTVLFVTHDQEEAMSISDRVMVLSGGKVEQFGTPEDIYDRPSTDFIAGFVGLVNFIDGTVKQMDAQGHRIQVKSVLGDIEVAGKGENVRIGDRIRLVIRPESITVYSNPGEIRKENFFQGEITSSIYTGSLIKYEVRSGDCRLFVEQYNPKICGKLAVGSRVGLEISKQLHFLKGKP